MPISLTEAACNVLNEPIPERKVRLTRDYCRAWRSGLIRDIGSCLPPSQPGRPAKPELKSPRDMPKRRATGIAGRIAFVHAITHIEFNAINLAWDMVARFTVDNLPWEFYDDWVGIALDEAEHFHMLAARLSELGSFYGQLAAHDGLWDAARTTDDDVLARLAIVPMTLEARGLDTTPAAITRLNQAGDPESAAILQRIATEEIPHVTAGVRWFEYVCQQRKLDPVLSYRTFIRTRFGGTLKPPFNRTARSQAGMNIAYYDGYDGFHDGD